MTISNAADIYRVDFEGVLNGDDFIIAISGAPAALVADYPEVIDAVRFRQRGSFLVKRKDDIETIKEENTAFVDPNFFTSNYFKVT